MDLVILPTHNYLYDTLVAPVMDYGSCIWGFEHYSTLEFEATRNNALRFFLGVGRNHPIAALQGDMGWIPAGFRHNLQFIKWWLRTRSQEPNRISTKVFTWSMRLAEGDKIRNWCWQVRKLLTCLLVKDGLNCYTNQSLKTQNQVVAKLKLYKLFKAAPTPASCVLSPLDPGPRWVMASLRAGCLPLGALPDS